MILSDFRNVFRQPLMGNVGFTQETAEAVIASGDADFIAFGRPCISNPDLVQRFANGWPLAESADISTRYSFGEKGYAEYPNYDAD